MEAGSDVIESAQDVLNRLGAIGSDAREELSYTDAVKLAWAKTCNNKSEQWSRRMQRSERPVEVLERLGRKRRSGWSRLDMFKWAWAMCAPHSKEGWTKRVLRPEQADEVIMRLKGVQPEHLNGEDRTRLTWAKTQYDKSKQVLSPPDKFESEPWLDMYLPKVTAPANRVDDTVLYAVDGQDDGKGEAGVSDPQADEVLVDEALVDRAREDELPPWLLDSSRGTPPILNEPIWVERIRHGKMIVSGPFTVSEITDNTIRLVK